MHKKTIILLTIISLTLVTAVPVFAVKPAGPSSTNGLNKGKNDHLYLYEKDPTTWEIVENPKWAKMNINSKTNKFVCNAHGLTPNENYSLICYQDPWPGTGSFLLGNDTADEEGNIHIKGTINFESLPYWEYTIGEGEDQYTVTGSKIWLILSSDFNENTKEMDAWNPTEYLFEFDLLNQNIVN